MKRTDVIKITTLRSVKKLELRLFVDHSFLQSVLLPLLIDLPPHMLAAIIKVVL